MSITDEHVLLDVKTKMKKLIAILDKDISTAILLHQKKQGIVGVITIDDIQRAVNEGKQVRKLKAKDLMCTDLLELHDDVPLEDALAVIAEQRPAAVIVRQRDGAFAGFFSPQDYEEAEDMLAASKAQAESFESRSGELASNISGLMQEMHEGGEEPPDEAQPPADLRSIPMSDAEKFLSRVRGQALDEDEGHDMLDIIDEAAPAVLDPLIDAAQEVVETVVEQTTARVAGFDAAKIAGEAIHDVGEAVQEVVTGHAEATRSESDKFCRFCGSSSTPARPPAKPSPSLEGGLGDDGYEWLVFPPGSSNYYYREPNADEWNPF